MNTGVSFSTALVLLLSSVVSVHSFFAGSSYTLWQRRSTALYVSYLDQLSSPSKETSRPSSPTDSANGSDIPAFVSDSYWTSISEECNGDMPSDNCKKSISAYLEALSAGNTKPSLTPVAEITSHIGIRSSDAPPAATGMAIAQYLDSVAAGSVATPSQMAVSKYLDGIFSGVVRAPTSAQEISSYMDAISGRNAQGATAQTPLGVPTSSDFSRQQSSGINVLTQPAAERKKEETRPPAPKAGNKENEQHKVTVSRPIFTPDKVNSQRLVELQRAHDSESGRRELLGAILSGIGILLVGTPSQKYIEGADLGTVERNDSSFGDAAVKEAAVVEPTPKLAPKPINSEFVKEKPVVVGEKDDTMTLEAATAEPAKPDPAPPQVTFNLYSERY